MATRLVIAAVLVVLAVGVARRIERRRPDAPTRRAYLIPAQVDRDDFPRPEAPWLVVLFSSRTCDSCESVAAKVAALESDSVATCEVEAFERRDLHARYGVEGVPLVVVADADGVVVTGFVGTVTAADLRAALPL
jgi:thioredoxin-related protein